MTVIQRFGGGLNLNLHFHTLLFDGVFFEGQQAALDFRPLPAPTDDEVGVVLARIAERVLRLLKRRGLDSGDAGRASLGVGRSDEARVRYRRADLPALRRTPAFDRYH